MRNIPKLALESYKNQYYELSALFPDFFVWATQREHEEILHSIDVGFDNISKKLNNIAEVIPVAVKSNIPVRSPINPISFALARAP